VNSVTCPHCQKTINVRPEHSGKRAKCPGCQQVFTVPHFGEVSLPVPVPAQPVASPPPQHFTQGYHQPQYPPPQPVLVMAAHPPEPRLQSGGWFLRSFASTTGILLAIACFLTVGVMTCCGGFVYFSMNGVTAAVEEMEKREREARPVEIASTPAAPIVAPSGSDSPPPVAPPESATSSPPVKEVDRVDYPAGLSKEGIEVVPVSVSVGPVSLDNKIGDGTFDSDKSYFVLKLKVRNTSKTKRVRFSGWPGSNSFLSNLTLKDEHDNRYRGMDFGFAVDVAGDDSGETIEPEAEANAVVVCEAPIAAANELLIDLEGSAVGLDKTTFKWRIKRSNWGG
jgi:hypothetical protein